jgi:hypothetical protein
VDLFGQLAGVGHPARAAVVADLQVLDDLVHLVVFVQRVPRDVEAGVLHQDRRVQEAFLGSGVRGELDPQLGEQRDPPFGMRCRTQQPAAQRALAFVAFAQRVVDRLGHGRPPQ